jgi:hypothetical protein
MKVSILSKGKITTTQYNNVSVDGQVEVMGGGGIEVETDPIFNAWKDSEYSVLQNSVQTNSEEINQTKGRVTTLSNSVNELNTTVTTLGCNIATKADASTVSTLGCNVSSLCGTVGCLCSEVVGLWDNVSGLSDNVSSLCGTVGCLGCSLGSKISYSDLGFCSTGYCSNYITVHGISTSNLYPIDCGTPINISCISVDYIAPYNNNHENCVYIPRISTDVISVDGGSFVFDARYSNIDIMSQEAIFIISSLSFKDSPDHCTGYLDIRRSHSCVGYSTYINADFDYGYIDFYNSCANSYTEVSVDDRGFSFNADVYGDGCTRDRYSITRWMEAPDGLGGYIPVFEAGS